jgi:hypothetical protein
MVTGKTTSLNRQLIHLQQLSQTLVFINDNEFFSSDEKMELVDGLIKEIESIKKHVEYELHTRKKIA